MPGLRRILALALVLFGLASCAPSLDAEQGRLCRMLLPALYPEDEGITVLTSEPGQRNAVHVAFRLGRGDMPGKRHLLTCRFGGTGFSAAKRDLSSVQVDGIGIGEMAFYFLKERWLESQHAIPADPGPPKNRQVLRLSHDLAVSAQHVINGLPRVGILALLALATALIYGLLGRINLAFGEFAALGGIATTITALILGLSADLPVWVIAIIAILNALSLGALYGLITGQTVLWPLSHGRGQPLLVAGVGLLIIVQEGLRLAQGAGTLWLPPVGGDALVLAQAGGFTVTASPRLLAMTALDCAAILFTLILMKKSRFGRAWRAMADDPFAASLMGIDPKAVLVGASALSTMLAALAGATIALNYGGIHFSGGTMLGLTALIAAILGGIGSLGGAVFGAALIGAFQVAWSALQPIANWELASFILVTCALILKPEGFFGIGIDQQRYR